MAKKKKTAYERERERYLRKVRQLRNAGYEPVNSAIPTLRQLRQEGYKGSDITKYVNYIKTLSTPEAEIIDTLTGESLTLQEATRREHNRAQRLKKIEKENERRFWAGEEQIPVPESFQERQSYKPDGGEAIYNNMYEQMGGTDYSEYYDSLFNDVQMGEGERDLSGSSDYAKRKYARKADAKAATESARSLILEAMSEEASKRGKSSVGWSIANNLDADAIDLMFYGYSDDLVLRGMNSILSAIRERPITMEEQKILSEEYEEYEGWEEY